MTLPQDTYAEKIVLGSIIGSYETYIQISNIISCDSFFDLINKDIYKAIDAIYKRGDKCDIITVNNELKKQQSIVDFNYLIDINGLYSIDCIPHACIIQDKYLRRNVYQLTINMANKACRDDLDIIDVISELSEETKNIITSDKEEIITMPEAVKELTETMNKNASDDKSITGMVTGFEIIDKYTGGLQGSDLTVIAAETSQGKTSFALSMLSNIAHNSPCAIYSLEMSSRQLTARLASQETGIPSNELLYSKLQDYQFLKFDNNIQKLCQKPIFIDPRSTISIEGILSSIRRLHVKYGLKMAVIDYLQIIPMKGKIEELTAQYARQLKNLAKELDIHIILLSQLNRNESHVPTLSRLRSSGQIEETADNVVLIYRPEMFNISFPEPFNNYETKGYAMIDWAKGRNVGTFKLLAAFNKFTTHFTDINISDVPQKDKDIDDKPF